MSANCKCSIGIYPFGDGKLEDFEPVFTKLIEVGPLSYLSQRYAIFLKQPYRRAIFALPTTLTLTPLPSYTSPPPSNNAPKSPKNWTTSPWHQTSTCAPPLSTASPASRSRAPRSKRKHGPSTKPRTSKARSSSPAHSPTSKYRTRTASKGRAPPSPSTCASQQPPQQPTPSHVSSKSSVWTATGPK